MTEIRIIPVLNDNYCYAIHDGGQTAIIDPGESGPVIRFLQKSGWKADIILITHHHGDHTGGIQELKRLYGSRVFGPAAEISRIPGIDHPLREGDTVQIGGTTAQVIETPGHTKGHIVYWLPDAQALFSGDTLFSLGCGRLFEGTAEEMWQSLQKLSALPDETMLYCGHEYTEANGVFALSVDPDNPDLATRMKIVTALRAKGQPTLPVPLKTERITNPFLRTQSAIKFALLRERKDKFLPPPEGEGRGGGSRAVGP